MFSLVSCDSFDSEINNFIWYETKVKSQRANNTFQHTHFDQSVLLPFFKTFDIERPTVVTLTPISQNLYLMKPQRRICCWFCMRIVKYTCYVLNTKFDSISSSHIISCVFCIFSILAPPLFLS